MQLSNIMRCSDTWPLGTLRPVHVGAMLLCYMVIGGFGARFALLGDFLFADHLPGLVGTRSTLGCFCRWLGSTHLVGASWVSCYVGRVGGSRVHAFAYMRTYNVVLLLVLKGGFFMLVPRFSLGSTFLQFHLSLCYVRFLVAAAAALLWLHSRHSRTGH